MATEDLPDYHLPRVVQIDHVELVDLISEITLIKTINDILQIDNVSSIDLIDRISLIDEITLIKNIDVIGKILSLGRIEALQVGLIKNGDFETGDFTCWTYNAQASITEETVYTGDYACKLEPGGEISQPTLPFRTCEIYGVIAFKTPDLTKTLKVRAYFTNTEYEEKSIAIYAGEENQWTVRLISDFTNTNRVVRVAFVNDSADATYYVDAILLFGLRQQAIHDYSTPSYVAAVDVDGNLHVKPPTLEIKNIDGDDAFVGLHSDYEAVPVKTRNGELVTTDLTDDVSREVGIVTVEQSDETQLKATVTQAAKDRTISDVTKTATATSVTASSSGNNTVWDPAAGKKVRVKLVDVWNNGNVVITVYLRFAAGGTARFKKTLASSTGFIVNLVGCNWEGAADEDLIINLSDAGTVGVTVLGEEV